MSDVYMQSLEAAKPVLQKKVLVGNILPKLHKSEVLDESERDKVKSGRSNRTKMHILLEILKTKNKAVLTTFYKVLEDSKYVEAAEKLKKEIASRGRYCSAKDPDKNCQFKVIRLSYMHCILPSAHYVSDTT